MKVGVATLEDTHSQQQFMYVMSRQEDRRRDITTNSGKVSKDLSRCHDIKRHPFNNTVPGADVAIGVVMTRHHDQQLKSAVCLGGCRDKRNEVATSEAIN